MDLLNLSKILCLSAFALVTSPKPSLAADSVLMEPPDVLMLPSTKADYHIAYGADSLQFGELRLPTGPGPFPVAVVIHGGCWISRFADLHLMDPLASELTRTGIATWNLEYRPLDKPGGGWPGTFEDVAGGVDRLRDLAAKNALDSTRVVVVGHSAGGHLALWAAGRHRLSENSPVYCKNPLRISGVVSLGGVADLAVFQPRGQMVCGTDVIGQLLGGSPEQVPDRYRQASPRALLPLGTKQVLITGTQDLVMLPEQNQAYQSAAREAGDEVDLVQPEGAGHFEVIAPNSAIWPLIEQAILGLVGIRASSTTGER